MRRLLVHPPSPWPPVVGSLVIALLGTGLGVSVLSGIVSLLGSASPGRDAIGRSVPWLFPADDLASWLANAPLVLFDIALFTVLARRLLRDSDGRTVGFLPLFLIVAATSAVATLPEYDSDTVAAAWLLPLAGAAWFIRHLPQTEPRPARPHDRLIVPVAVSVGLILLAVPVTYGALHPVRLDSPSAPPGGLEIAERQDPVMSVSISNAGYRDLEVRSIAFIPPLAGVRLSAPQGHSGRRLGFPRTIGAKDELDVYVTARLPPGGCRELMVNDDPVASLVSYVDVAYRVSGRDLSVRLPARTALPLRSCEGRETGYQWGA